MMNRARQNKEKEKSKTKPEAGNEDEVETPPAKQPRKSISSYFIPKAKTDKPPPEPIVTSPEKKPCEKTIKILNSFSASREDDEKGTPNVEKQVIIHTVVCLWLFEIGDILPVLRCLKKIFLLLKYKRSHSKFTHSCTKIA